MARKTVKYDVEELFSELVHLNAVDLSFRLHREISAVDLRAKSKKGPKPPRGFPSDRAFWDRVLCLYEHKTGFGQKPDKNLFDEIAHLRKKIEVVLSLDENSNPVQAESCGDGPPVKASLEVLSKSFRRWLRFRKLLSGENLSLRQFLDEIISSTTLAHSFAGSTQKLSDSKAEAVASLIQKELIEKWGVTDSIFAKHKHKTILLVLRNAAVDLTSFLDRRESATNMLRLMPTETTAFPETRKLPWALLPPGDWTLHSIVGSRVATRHRPNGNSDQFIEDRLNEIVRWLSPTHCYIGENEFDGYVVFCFGESPIVVLDSPLYGNAVYAIRGDWQRITRLSKATSLQQFPNDVKRVIHSQNWIHNLQAAIKGWK